MHARRKLLRPKLEFKPLTAERWADLQALFGPRGAYSGCWCMWWRCSRREFERNGNAGNRKAFRQLVMEGETPGILAYADGQAVGWCSVAPRQSYPSLLRSRTLKAVDDRPAWSIVCFFVAREHRRSGLSVRLLEAAVDFARGKGATVLEGYPTEPKEGGEVDLFVYHGLRSAFDRVGFSEVARRSEKRPVMRLEL